MIADDLMNDDTLGLLILQLCFVVAGFQSGFTLPVVIGILGTMAFMFRADFLPKERPIEARDAAAPPAIPLEFERTLNDLQSQITRLDMKFAFKLGEVKKESGARQ